MAEKLVVHRAFVSQVLLKEYSCLKYLKAAGGKNVLVDQPKRLESKKLQEYSSHNGKGM